MCVCVTDLQQKGYIALSNSLTRNENWFKLLGFEISNSVGENEVFENKLLIQHYGYGLVGMSTFLTNGSS